MPFFTCELSGETIEQDVVVTPSGHICRRSLLLKALSENGGMDPFHQDRPLAEDNLIVVQQTASSVATPSTIPLATSTATNSHTMTATLQQLQAEYDAVVLDLFETRRLLQETRQELTQALYQNDAAVRVVARLAMERDQARAARQQEWTTKGGASQKAVNNNDDKNNENDDAVAPPAAKKAKTEDASPIPEADLQIMTKAWEESHATRKARQKAKKAPSLEGWDLRTTSSVAQKGSFSSTHPESKDGETLVALAWNAHSKLVTLVSNQSLVQYDTSPEATDQLDVTIGTLSSSDGAVVLDTADSTIVVGLRNGSVDWLDMSNGNNDNNDTHTCSMGDGAVVMDVRLHPDGHHCIAATSNGMVALLSRPGTVVARLEHPDNHNSGDTIAYSAGALHPDGLIYVAGTSNGALCLWDFTKQALSATLETKTNSSGAVTAVAASNNGYHVAAAYANATVVLWDLRKRSIIVTLNNQDDGDNVLTSVTANQFDDSGKYLAYSGTRGDNNSKSVVVKVVEVKKGTEVAQFEAKGYTTANCRGLVWGDAWIAVAAVESETGRPRALFLGL